MQLEKENENAILEQEQKHFHLSEVALARRVEEVMQSMGVTYWKFTPRQYFIWLQWSRRYRVSFEKIVSMTVTEARRWFNKTGSSLGVYSGTPTGPKIAAWLDEQFAGKRITSEVPPTTYVTSSPIIDPVKYGEDMEKLRRTRFQRQSALRSYRGSSKWQPPRRVDDPVLKLFGYRED